MCNIYSLIIFEFTIYVCGVLSFPYFLHQGKKKHKVKKRPKEDFVHDIDYTKTLPKSNLSKVCIKVIL
jgi:hypothetical protein